MNESDDRKKHWNLYHILHIDKAQHPMPVGFMKKLQQKIEELIKNKKGQTQSND